MCININGKPNAISWYNRDSGLGYSEWGHVFYSFLFLFIPFLFFHDSFKKLIASSTVKSEPEHVWEHLSLKQVIMRALLQKINALKKLSGCLLNWRGFELYDKLTMKYVI